MQEQVREKSLFFPVQKSVPHPGPLVLDQFSLAELLQRHRDGTDRNAERFRQLVRGEPFPLMLIQVFDDVLLTHFMTPRALPDDEGNDHEDQSHADSTPRDERKEIEPLEVGLDLLEKLLHALQGDIDRLTHIPSIAERL